ncbi:hypothetical protein AB3S75_011994 [Citrus x aurantiifolia]
MDDRDPLPRHIIDDILSRLHVKQLLRLRCVSKTWRDLIDRPDLIKLQLSRNQASDRSVITVGLGSTDTLYEEKYEKGCIATKLDHPWMDSKQWIEVVGCCNGLLCIATNRLPQTLAIWTHLRESTAFYRRQRLPWIPPCYVARDSPGVYASGSLHWIAMAEYGRHDFILALDLSDEDYKELPLPPPVLLETGCRVRANYFGVLDNGCLCLVSNYGGGYITPLSHVCVVLIHWLN